MKRVWIQTRFFIVFLVCVAVYGCAPPSVQDPLLSEIPENAAEIRLQTDLDADAVFVEIWEELSRRAYRFASSSNPRRSIRTNYKNIGGGLRLAIHVTVEDGVNNSRSVCIFRGYVARLGERIEPVRWTKNGGDRAGAFREMRDVASKIPHELMLYGVPL